MSADQALTRAQERMNSNIDAAVNAGSTGQLQKSMNVALKLASGKSVRLVSADGVPTREGGSLLLQTWHRPSSDIPVRAGPSEWQVGGRFRWEEEVGPTYGSRRILASDVAGSQLF